MVEGEAGGLGAESDLSQILPGQSAPMPRLAESEPREAVGTLGPLAAHLTPTSSWPNSYGGQDEAQDHKIDEDGQDILNDRCDRTRSVRRIDFEAGQRPRQ